jgi:hypothetical protein
LRITLTEKSRYFIISHLPVYYTLTPDTEALTAAVAAAGYFPTQTATVDTGCFLAQAASFEGLVDAGCFLAQMATVDTGCFLAQTASVEVLPAAASVTAAALGWCFRPSLAQTAAPEVLADSMSAAEAAAAAASCRRPWAAPRTAPVAAGMLG